MILSSESTAAFGSGLGAHAAAVFDKLRDLAPYAAIELVLPGGSLIALVLWFYRRQRSFNERAPAGGGPPAPGA